MVNRKNWGTKVSKKGNKPKAPGLIERELSGNTYKYWQVQKGDSWATAMAKTRKNLQQAHQVDGLQGTVLGGLGSFRYNAGAPLSSRYTGQLPHEVQAHWYKNVSTIVQNYGRFMKAHEEV